MDAVHSHPVAPVGPNRCGAGNPIRYANTYPTALLLIESGIVDVDAIITHRFSLADTESALTLARRDPASLKAVVVMGEPVDDPGKRSG